MKTSRALLLAAAALGALLAVADYRAWSRSRGELAALVRDAGLGARHPTLADTLRLERTPSHARSRVARVLVHDVLGARPADAEPAEGASSVLLTVGSPAWRRTAEHLGTAAELARRAAAENAAGWEGLAMNGTAVYLDRWTRQDRRLFEAPGDWEKPLEAAMLLAPGRREPRRFLAAAYVGLWPALPPSRRERARAVLADALRDDPAAFDLLMPSWRRTVDDDEVFAVMPPISRRWEALARLEARDGDWPRFCEVHRRYREALRGELEAQLEEASERLRLGENFHSRSLLLQLVVRAPRDRAFAPLVTAALERYPAGMHGLGSTAALAEWLDWALQLEAAGHEVLPPHVVGRLAGAAGGLPPEKAALAAMVAGEVTRAERLEALVDSLRFEAWGPYLVAKARWLLSRGKAAEAADLLAVADRATAATIPYAHVRLELARSGGPLAELADAEAQLAALRRREWSAAEWRIHRSSRVAGRGSNAVEARLLLLPERSEGLVLDLHRVPEGGAVVALILDGAEPELYSLAGPPAGAVSQGERVVLRRSLASEPHLLELRMLAGGSLLPGSVRLLGDD